MAGIPNRKKVLVVEDAFEIRLALELSLSQEGCEVIVAVDGEDGLTKFREHTPDLVVLDLRMPGLDGSSVCKSIRQTSSVPVVVFSALDQPDEVREAIDAGATDFVLKSTGVDELLKRVNHWLDALDMRAVAKEGMTGVHTRSHSRQLDVLILDPEPAASRAIADEIEKLGHRAKVIRASARQEPVQGIDLAILDYAMPKGIGVDLVEAISDAQRNQPLGLIIASKSNPPEQRRRLKNCLLLDFIEKPWEKWELPVRLSVAIDLYCRRTRMSA